MVTQNFIFHLIKELAGATQKSDFGKNVYQENQVRSRKDRGN
jgi:hypothetical protein